MTSDLEAVLAVIQAEHDRLLNEYFRAPRGSAYGVNCACKCAGLVFAADVIRARLATYKSPGHLTTYEAGSGICEPGESGYKPRKWHPSMLVPKYEGERW